MCPARRPPLSSSHRDRRDSLGAALRSSSDPRPVARASARRRRRARWPWPKFTCASREVIPATRGGVREPSNPRLSSAGDDRCKRAELNAAHALATPPRPIRRSPPPIPLRRRPPASRRPPPASRTRRTASRLARDAPRSPQRASPFVRPACRLVRPALRRPLPTVRRLRSAFRLRRDACPLLRNLSRRRRPTLPPRHDPAAAPHHRTRGARITSAPTRHPSPPPAPAFSLRRKPRVATRIPRGSNGTKSAPPSPPDVRLASPSSRHSPACQGARPSPHPALRPVQPSHRKRGESP